jgi:hypothetical protein
MHVVLQVLSNIHPTFDFVCYTLSLVEKEIQIINFPKKKLDVGKIVTILIFVKTNGFQYEVIVASNLYHRPPKP